MKTFIEIQTWTDEFLEEQIQDIVKIRLNLGEHYKRINNSETSLSEYHASHSLISKLKDREVSSPGLMKYCVIDAVNRRLEALALSVDPKDYLANLNYLSTDFFSRSLRQSAEASYLTLLKHVGSF